MSRRFCPRHGRDYPCTCAMGHLYRFVEPVVLLLLKKKGACYGYDLFKQVGDFALTDAAIERAALYRTLRNLEANGNVRSRWHTKSHGPARRVYALTPEGERHLEEWAVVLDHLARSMTRFVRQVRALQSSGGVRIRAVRPESEKRPRRRLIAPVAGKAASAAAR